MDHKTLFTDTESTGLPPERIVPGKRPGTTKKERLPYDTHYMDFPHIVRMAWAINDEEPKDYILNQEGREIPKEASDIHGITTEIANKSKHFFSDVILECIDDAEGCEIVVGHGLYFDTSIIKANVLRELDRIPNKPEIFKNTIPTNTYDLIEEILHKHKRIDTMRSSASFMHGWPTLSELHLKLFRKGFKAHDAKEDLEAMRRCYYWLLKKKIVPTWEKLQEKARESADG